MSVKFDAARIVCVDLVDGNVTSPNTNDNNYSRVWALARLHEQPIGFIEVEASTNHDIVEQTRKIALEQHAAEITEHLAADNSTTKLPETDGDWRNLTNNCPRLQAVSGGPLVSVVIATLRNVESVVTCVRHILSSTYENFEVIVVDNDKEPAALSAAIESAFADDNSVRYLHEPQRGVSRARNKGSAHANGEIIVFTDDDVCVDKRWLERIVSAFDASSDVACVTGSILPAELETASQSWLEEFGGFNKGFLPQIFNLTDHKRSEPLYPFDSGRFGSGANMAFRSEAFKALGGFAVELGPGTPTWGGEDIDLLRRVVSSGHTLVYEPAALLWHFHRRSYKALRKQMFHYGIGLSATVTKWLLEDRATTRAVLSRVPAGLSHVLRPGSKKNSRKSPGYPSALTRLEIVGLVVGPIAYLQSRSRVGKDDRTSTTRSQRLGPHTGMKPN